MYTEETVLNYGSCKGMKIKDVPRRYLINIYRSGGKEHDKLKEWISANIDNFPTLKLENMRGEFVPFICDKRTFATKKAAMDSIVKPKSKNHKPVPIRAYECDICSGWHLTSKPDRRFNNEGQD